MLSRLVAAACLVGVFSASGMAADQTHQSQLNPTRAAEAKKYPQIVLYSVAWCPHCKETKDYFTRNNIPFINRDVEIDAKAMDDLTIKYNSTGVPVIVIGTGKDEVVVRGFTPESFQNGLKKVPSHK